MTAVADPALRFWLRHVAAAGGLWEPDGDTSYVVLPPPLRDAYRLPEELRVTADPDVAREDGATLLAAGHAVLAEAAERVLASGDAGYMVLARPASIPPGRDVLLAAAREAFPVDHGRIDLSGEPAVVLHPVVRVGALVTYELSAEDRFQEEARRWVDVPSQRELPADLVGRLCRAEADEQAPRPGRAEGLLPAIAAAHRLMDTAALARRQVLAAEVRDACQSERGRAVAYYADAITAIERRLATAPADRRAVLEERLRSTREEETRRLAEIAEKYEARHVIRPYRLHVMLVPALCVPADVLRGDRRYPMCFDWLLPAGAYAPVRCPSCADEAPLVAGKLKLGCEACLPPKPSAAQGTAAQGAAAKPAAAAPTPAAAPAVATAAAAPAAAAPGKPRGTRPAPPARPVPPRAKQRAVVPPKVRKEQQKATTTLAERLWCAVAADDRRAVSRILHPASPAASLHQMLGPAGLCRVLGMPVGEAPERFLAETAGDVIVGALLGAAGTECPYHLYCRDGQAAEVLPFPLGDDGAFWGFYWWGKRPGGRWPAGRIVPAKGLDPVEVALAGTGSAWNGLPVTARALAAWGRIAADQERLRSAHAAPSLAAAVNRLVACRAGGRATFAEAAAQFRVPEQDVRRADRAVRAPLALGPGQPW